MPFALPTTYYNASFNAPLILYLVFDASLNTFSYCRAYSEKPAGRTESSFSPNVRAGDGNSILCLYFVSLKKVSEATKNLGVTQIIVQYLYLDTYLASSRIHQILNLTTHLFHFINQYHHNINIVGWIEL